MLKIASALRALGGKSGLIKTIIIIENLEFRVLLRKKNGRDGRDGRDDGSVLKVLKVLKDLKVPNFTNSPKPL